MNASFNPYAEWLGLPTTTGRPDYFELLGVERGEQDRETIRHAADRAISQVRSIKPGPHAAIWAQTLDELNQAKQTLLDAQKRNEYVAGLADASAEGPGEPRGETQRDPAGESSPPAAAKPAPPVSAAPEMLVETHQPSDSELAAKYPPGYRPPGAPATGGTPAAQPSSSDPAATSPASGPAPQSAAPGCAAPGANTPGEAQPAPSAPDPMAPAGPLSASASTAAAQARSSSPAPQPPSQAQPHAAHDPMAPAAAASAPVARPVSPAAPQGIAAVQPASGPPVGPVPVGEAVPAPIARPRSASHQASRRRRQSWSGPLSILIGLIVLGVMAGAVYYGIQSRNRAIADRTEPAGNPNGEETSDPNGDPQVGTGAGSASGDIADAGQAPEATGTNETDTSAGSGESQPNLGGPDAGAGNAPPITPPADNGSPEDAGSEPLTNDPAVDGSSPNRPPEPGAGGPEKGDSEKVDTEKADPESEPDSPLSPPPPSGPSPQEVAAFRDAMLAAYDAISLHQFDRAEEQLAKAKAAARTEQHRAMYARLAEIGDYVKQYRAALEKSLEDLNGGTVFQIGEYTVALIEKGDDFIAFRVRGQNRRYNLNVLPATTGLALGDMVLDQADPTTRVLQGAYLLAHPRIDQKQLGMVRGLWTQAAEAGADIEHLMAALDDDYAAIQ